MDTGDDYENGIGPSTTDGETEYYFNAEEGEGEKEGSILTIYDTNDYISTAVLSDDATIPINMIDFNHSFGYDCKRHYNLCVCDENVLAWSSGCMITFFHVRTKTIWFKRCSTGGGVGYIARNPNCELSHIAVAEGGQSWAPPIIIIYEWPEMKIVSVLKEGTTKSYSHLDYSPDGEMLASIGCEPDYNITIWNWRKRRITLRASAFTNSVYNVRFSPYIPAHLTTSGRLTVT